MRQLKQLKKYLERILDSSESARDGGFWLLLVVSAVLVLFFFIVLKIGTTTPGDGVLTTKFTWIFIVGFVAGVYFSNNNYWWMLVSGHYIDKGISLTARALIKDRGWIIVVTVIYMVFFPIFYASLERSNIWYSSWSWLLQFIAWLFLLLWAYIFFYGFLYILAFILAVMINLFVLQALVLVPILRLPGYFLYYVFGIIAASMVVKLFKLLSAYSKALELKIIISKRHLYSEKEFNQQIRNILFNTEQALPDYWEEKFKAKEIENLVKEMKIENSYKESILTVKRGEIDSRARKGQI